MSTDEIKDRLLQKNGWIAEEFTPLGDDIYLVRYKTSAQMLEYCFVDRGCNTFSLYPQNMATLYDYFERNW